MSKEAKPIAVVYYKEKVGINLQQILEDRWTDYHVCVVPNPRQERMIELEVFYDKDFTDTNYEDLKKWIENYIQPSPPTDK